METSQPWSTLLGPAISVCALHWKLAYCEISWKKSIQALQSADDSLVAPYGNIIW